MKAPHTACRSRRCRRSSIPYLSSMLSRNSKHTFSNRNAAAQNYMLKAWYQEQSRTRMSFRRLAATIVWVTMSLLCSYSPKPLRLPPMAAGRFPLACISVSLRIRWTTSHSAPSIMTPSLPLRSQIPHHPYVAYCPPAIPPNQLACRPPGIAQATAPASSPTPRRIVPETRAACLATNAPAPQASGKTQMVRKRQPYGEARHVRRKTSLRHSGFSHRSPCSWCSSSAGLSALC